MNSEAGQALTRELRRLTALELRAKERVDLAVSEYRARCMDEDLDGMVRAREEATARFEALLDLVSDKQDQERAVLNFIIKFGG